MLYTTTRHKEVFKSYHHNNFAVHNKDLPSVHRLGKVCIDKLDTRIHNNIKPSWLPRASVEESEFTTFDLGWKVLSFGKRCWLSVVSCMKTMKNENNSRLVKVSGLSTQKEHINTNNNNKHQGLGNRVELLGVPWNVVPGTRVTLKLTSQK